MQLNFFLALLGLLFVTMFTTGTAACKCRNEDWSVDWDASYKCCNMATGGLWIAKDCKGAVDGQVFWLCCHARYRGADCSLRAAAEAAVETGAARNEVASG